MPIVKSNLVGEAPKGPHLGVLRDNAGTVLAIPPGAMMFLIMDPTRVDGTTPMVLTEVSLKRLVFRCACGNSECTRVMKYRLEPSGWHPTSKQVIATQKR